MFLFSFCEWKVAVRPEISIGQVSCEFSVFGVVVTSTSGGDQLWTEPFWVWKSG